MEERKDIAEVQKYNFSEISEVREKFQKLFGVKFKPYHDMLTSAIFKFIVIDIVKFDDYLMSKYNYTSEKEISMSAFVINKFGVEAWRLLQKLLP